MKEENEHKQVCEYLKMQYPKVLFNTDLSGIRLTMGQAVKAKKFRSSNGFPDIVIYKASRKILFTPLSPVGGEIKKYHGLFIELKRKGEKIYKKDGVTPKNEHVSEQIDMLNKLQMEGYYACFCIGFDEAKKLIDWYLK